MSWKARIKDVIMALKSRTGSSLPAIKKALGCDQSQWRYINAALRSGVADGTFVKNGGKSVSYTHLTLPTKRIV